MTTILDGTKPLWPIFGMYADFIISHVDEIYDAVMSGDDNAELLVEAVLTLKERSADAKVRGVLVIAVERYIHDYHPDIAWIKGGYVKEVHD